MKKVISYSLWGDNPKYTVGAIRNAEETKKFYPGWESWFFCGSSVPNSVADKISSSGGIIIPRKENGDWRGMFWRFEPIAYPEVNVMISRDADSRLSTRESLAVKEWLDSDKLFHVMRDHPAHSVPILGGMWGARKPILGDMLELINSYNKGNFWQVDQNFLREIIWPRVSYTTYTHDEFFSKNCPFPSSRTNNEFVGDVFDENDVRHPEYWKDIAKIK